MSLTYQDALPLWLVSAATISLVVSLILAGLLLAARRRISRLLDEQEVLQDKIWHLTDSEEHYKTRLTEKSAKQHSQKTMQSRAG